MAHACVHSDHLIQALINDAYAHVSQEQESRVICMFSFAQQLLLFAQFAHNMAGKYQESMAPR